MAKVASDHFYHGAIQFGSYTNYQTNYQVIINENAEPVLQAQVDLNMLLYSLMLYQHPIGHIVFEFVTVQAENPALHK